MKKIVFTTVNRNESYFSHMKNARYSLRLDNPCTQSWDEMTPVEAGRFCESCQKTVVDFSEMTDNEVISFIQKNAGGFCGQFRGDQLNRKFTETKFTPRSSRLNTILSALTFTGLAGAVSAQTTTAPPKDVVIDSTHWSGPVCIRQNEKDTSDLVLNITVMDSVANEPLPYGLVTVVGNTKYAGQTDLDGKIVFRIPADSLTDSLSLEVRYVGFKRKIIDVSTDVRTQAITINMGAAEVIMLGGPMLISEPEKEKKPFFRQRKKD